MLLMLFLVNSEIACYPLLSVIDLTIVYGRQHTY